MWRLKSNSKLTAGSLIYDVPFFSKLVEDEPRITKFQFSIVLSQACDIESYYRIMEKMEGNGENDGPINRQMITQILFVPAFEEESFKAGRHFEEQYGIKLKGLEAGVFERIEKVQDIRYHFLVTEAADLPSLYVDFKHYFTAPVTLVELIAGASTKPQYELETLHYSDLADRFAHYLQRVPV